MADTITRDQLDALRYAVDSKEYHDLLEEYAGITARPYTAYAYYDEVGNYIGDSVNHDVDALLVNAYIKVEG